MATERQYDGDNAIERCRYCDDTTATVRYDYRIVAPENYCASWLGYHHVVGYDVMDFIQLCSAKDGPKPALKKEEGWAWG
ncbi:hypothetical protein DPMN_042651 [Dreissena polymorpha]|uniref:Uncharacterized protein n=1 Tax=Dreissena polymorpha TaxID=45954 RepID=A0A9D4HYZ0_DREPO|nr:hypothetical protein DPMN_042651 [Dreissena polymorpha]